MALQIRRGTEAQRATLTGVAGELLYTTDTKKLYVGDGVTAGGTEVTGAEAIDLTAPGPIGAVTPSTGAFTTLNSTGGALNGTLGATTASTGDFTTLTSSTSLDIGSTIAITGVLDEDTMSSDSAVKLATQQSIKAYVDTGLGGITTSNGFEAFLGTSTFPSSGVITKMTYQNVIYDTGSCYDNSVNYRFTPTVAGKYYVYSKNFFTSSSNNANFIHTYIYKNGLAYSYSRDFFVTTTYMNSFVGNTSSTIDMNGTTDYVEIFIQYNGSGLMMYGDPGRWSNFGAFRIIGV